MTQNEMIMNRPSFSPPKPMRCSPKVKASMAMPKPPAPQFDIQDLTRFLSPLSNEALGHLMTEAQQLTRQRFGYVMRLFAPLYLSNLCKNECTYCGFSMTNKVKRKTLSLKEIKRECQYLKKAGFDSVLLVTGEHETAVGMGYFRQVIPVIKQYFGYIMMEVQPLSVEDYKQLKGLGIEAIICYQECYDSERYQDYHKFGKKTDYPWRLATPERAAEAGFDKLGVGILLGLSDWQYEAKCLALHIQYLLTHFPASQISVSFPRLKACSGSSVNPYPVTERQLLQLICAFRLIFPSVEIVLSTRERSTFRDGALPFGVTHMSAGSITQPGGYGDNRWELAQFETEDHRPPSLVACRLKQLGFDVAWTDWTQQPGEY